MPKVLRLLGLSQRFKLIHILKKINLKKLFQSKITLMDIRKSCNEADIDFSGFPLETVLDLLVKAEFMNKDGGSFTVRVRHTIEKMMIESS